MPYKALVHELICAKNHKEDPIGGRADRRIGLEDFPPTEDGNFEKWKHQQLWGVVGTCSVVIFPNSLLETADLKCQFFVFVTCHQRLAFACHCICKAITQIMIL